MNHGHDNALDFRAPILTNHDKPISFLGSLAIFLCFLADSTLLKSVKNKIAISWMPEKEAMVVET